MFRNIGNKDTEKENSLVLLLMYLVVCVQIIFRYPSSYKMDKNSVWICVLSKYVLAVNLSLSLRYISTLPVFLHWCSSRICCFDNRSIICWVLFFITKISLFFRIYYILEDCYLEIDSSCICKVSLFSFFFFFLRIFHSLTGCCFYL